MDTVDISPLIGPPLDKHIPSNDKCALELTFSAEDIGHVVNQVGSEQLVACLLA